MSDYLAVGPLGPPCPRVVRRTHSLWKRESFPLFVSRNLLTGSTAPLPSPSAGRTRSTDLPSQHSFQFPLHRKINVAKRTMGTRKKCSTKHGALKFLITYLEASSVLQGLEREVERGLKGKPVYTGQGFSGGWEG